MTKITAYMYQQPCKNRNRKFQGYSAGAVIIDNQRFETMTEVENYLSKFKRTDIKLKEK